MQRRSLWLAAAMLTLAPLPGAAEISVSGRLEAEGGRPLPGALVRLLPVRDSHQANLDQLAGRLDPEAAAEALTGEDGRFELRAPEAGLWEVRAAAEGFVPMTAALRPLLEETFLPTLTVKPSRPLTVTVLGPGGEPVAGAAVTARSRSRHLWRSGPARRGIWSRPPSRAFTDGEGRAALERAEGERLEVGAGAAGLAPAEPTQSTGQTLELRLRPGRAVKLALRDAVDRPVAGALVMVGELSWAAGLTDEDGRLTVALDEDRVVTAVTREGARGRVTVPADAETVAVALSEPVRLAGRVIDADSRQPIAGALVWSNREMASMTRADAAGRFDLRAVPHGRQSWVNAAATGYFQDTARVSQSQEFEPVIALAPAAAATGAVVDANDEPVAGAELTARSVPDSPGTSRRVSQAHASSDEDGRFRFSGLTPGIPLQVEAVATGYAPSTLDLEAIPPRETRSALRLVLRRGASLSGRVTGAGEPLIGAGLTAVRSPESSSPMLLFARRGQLREELAAAGAEGRFELLNLHPGSYRLTVSAPGFASLLVPGVEVGDRGTDLGTLDLEPGVEITGIVVDGDGRPVADAEVRASGQESRSFGSFDRRGAEPQAVTGADGVFEVADRRAGERVDLHVSHADYRPAEALAVLAPTPQPLRIVLQAGARLSGTVLDPTGAPVADADVMVRVEEADVEPSGMGAQLFVFPVNASTDSSGRFELEQVPAGKVRLSASAQGWRTAELGSLEVLPGAEVTGLRVVLERGATVTGRVFAADGRPAVGARVRVQEERGVGMRFTLPISATTGGDGQYLLEGVEVGPRLISARAEDGESTAREIEVGPGVNRLDLRFAAGSTISGRVVDGGGAPLAGVTVMALTDARDWRGAEARSGADGAFTVEGLRDGQYQLRATREGYATSMLEEPVPVAGAPVTGIELLMTRGGAIVGAMFGLEESQIPLVSVFADGGTRQWAVGQVRHDGTYRIADLAPGEWDVQAAVPEGPKAQGRITLAPGESEVTLDLDFSSGVVLTGQVLRSGEAVAGLMVGLRGLDVAGRAGGRTDHEGRFRIAGLEPGRHRLEVAEFRGGLQHREEIELDGDRDVVIEIFTGRLAGRVLADDDLSPVAGARIVLEPAEEEPGAAGFRRWTASATTDDQGRFVIPNVSASAYRLKAVREGFAPAERLLTVAPGGDLADLELLLQPTSGLRLRVRGASGAPVAEIEWAILDDAGRPLDAGRRQADESGRARLPSAPAGSYELVIGAPGAASQRQRVTVPGPAVEVTLEPGCRLEVSVAALAEVGAATMRVTGIDGVPFVGVRWGGARAEWELHLGRQRITGLPAGSYTVEVTSADGRRWQGTVTLAPGAVTRLDL